MYLFGLFLKRADGHNIVNKHIGITKRGMHESTRTTITLNSRVAFIQSQHQNLLQCCMFAKVYNIWDHRAIMPPIIISNLLYV